MTATVFYDNVNELATITATFTNASNVPADPTTVSCAVTDPAAASTVHTFGGATPADITKVSTGVYQLIVPCSPSVSGVEGLWSYTFIGTGAVSDVQPGTWRVLATDQQKWYVGPEELKDRLGQTDSSTDSIITSVCLAASRWIDTYCVVPETPVLTADLRWVPAGSLRIGDELIGVDENPVGDRYRKRHYRRSQVMAVPHRQARCSRLILEDGREVTSALEHMWLVRSDGTGPVYHWMPTGEIQPGDEICAPLRTWPEETGFEAGWVSGILDGEGWIHTARPGPRNGTGVDVGMSQNPGAVFDRVLAYLKENDIPARLDNGAQTCRRIHVYPRWAVMELLGRLQPCRLMSRSAEAWEGGLVTGKGRNNIRVVAVQDAGIREVVSLGTSTGTYIANGLVSHNCGRHFFRITDTRTYAPTDIWLLNIDDLVSVTTLKIDNDGDGVYETTWTQGTNYQLRIADNQFNQLASGEPKPYTQVQVIGGTTGAASWFPFIWPFSHLDRVQITGVFGWPQVPPVVTQAALIIAADWFKLKDAPWGVAGIGDLGVIRLNPNPWVAEQLRCYIRGRGKVGV